MKFASACKQHKSGEAENEMKRRFGEPESIQATLASKRQKMNMAAMDTKGDSVSWREYEFIVCGVWNVAGIAEKDINSCL